MAQWPQRTIKEHKGSQRNGSQESQECRAPTLSKKMAHKSVKKCKKCKKKCKEKCKKKCFLTRAEWLYILVEGRGNLGPKQRGNLRPKQCFRP